MEMNRRNKNSNPVIKFTFLLILAFLVGFLIFYSIDNPDFIKNKITSISGSGEESGTVEESQVSEEDEAVKVEDISEQAEVMDGAVEANTDAASAESSETKDIIEDINVISSEDNIEEEIDSASSLSLWQKIKDFFARLTGKSSEPGSEDEYPSVTEINAYFCSIGEDEKLVSEKRTINAGSPEAAARNAINELLDGPSKSYHFPVIPAGTELLGLETRDGIAIINFSQEFLEESLDSRILDKYIIYSIVNTLTEIRGIEGVVFHIEGVRIKVYGNVDLSIPAIGNKDLISEEQE
jgi:hypothetical protein